MSCFPESVEGPNILKSDALEDYGVDKLREGINKTYDDGKFPEDLNKSIFIALPKKPGALNCEQHRPHEPRHEAHPQI